jgi:peroxiredoxin
VSNDQTAQEAGNYAKQTKATFPVLHDPKEAVYRALGVSTVPTNILYGRDGRVLFVQESEDVNSLKAAVAKAMAAKR